MPRSAYHTYPHNDFLETGERAGAALLRIARGEVRPVTAICRVPALVRGDELITATGKIGGAGAGGAGDRSGARRYLGGDVLGQSLHRCARSLLAQPDRHRQRRRVGLARGGQDVAGLLGRPRRDAGRASSRPEEAVRMANEATGTIVFVDAADATSSGASGDSNAVLKALFDYGYKGRALFPIVDAPAVEDAKRARDRRHDQDDARRHARSGPVHADAGRGEGADAHRRAGLERIARLRVVCRRYARCWRSGPHIVIATSRQISLYDRSLFYAHGQDPVRFDAIIQKSPHARYEFFAAWVERLIGVDAPGSTSANLPYLGHTVCKRPMYPMELDAGFVPEVKVFRRG